MLDVLRFFKGDYEKVGELGRKGDTASFRYDADYLARPHARSLSASLPLRAEAYQPFEFQGYFEGLVPEGRTRNELAYRLGLSPSNWIDLLEHLNCECIGALVFKRPESSLGEFTPSLTPFPLDRFDQLALTPALSAAEAAEISRLSLSGAQAKLGLIHTGSDPLSGWFTPHGLAPSTHIVKIPDENHPDLAINEFLCMEAARACGISTGACFVIPGKRPVFATERFDRVTNDECPVIDGISLPLRLHQEDLCQAAGLPSYGKYEIGETDNYVAIARRIIERFSSNAIEDKLGFARQVMFDYFIGNCDNHLKNYSFQYSIDWNNRSLAPAYDLVCTTVLGYSRLMGISIGDSRHIDAISLDDWKLFAEDLRLPEKTVLDELRTMRELVGSAVSHAATLTPFLVAHTVAESILRDMEPRLKSL